MATLTIRNLSDRVRDRLRMRAAKRGVSMEEEVRAILLQAVDSRPAVAPTMAVKELQSWVASCRKPSGQANDSETLIRDHRRETILEVVQAGEDPASVFGENYRRVLVEAEWSAKHVKSLARQRR